MVDLDDLGRRLEALLSSREPGPVRVEDLSVLTGGYSLVTVAFTATMAGGSQRYVLRIDPPGDAALSRTDRVAEGELLAALTRAGTVPIPALRWSDLSGAVLGAPALISDYVDGPQLLSQLRGVGEDEQRSLALKLAETIAVVHVEGGAAPASMNRPASWDAYIDSFVESWRGLEAAYPEHNPFIRWVAAWLDSHRPVPAPLTLVHGEFQTANVMLDAAGGMRVIDWEYAHIGDPRIDLGWVQAVAAFSPPDPIALDPVGFCHRYCEVTGLGDEIVNPATVAWFAVAAGFKAFGGLLEGMAALAAGSNHLVTSAYLVSAMPFSHRLWRDSVRGLEAAMTGIESGMEVVS
ncbi:MAG TPA: phosphotransferase family protein [Acidimicrobiales bacterium]